MAKANEWNARTRHATSDEGVDSMSRNSVLRLAAGVLLFPIAASVSVECGGNDIIDSADATADATFDVRADGVSEADLADRASETSSEEAAMPEAETDAQGPLEDAPGDSPDMADAGDGDRGDTSGADADAGRDASDGAADAERADASDGAADAEAGDASGADADAGRDASDGAGDAEAGFEGGEIAAPALGGAKTFAVLAGSTITNTGVTTAIVGDVGISPGTALVGLTAGQVNGTLHLGDPVAMQAEADLTTAYNNLVGRPCLQTMTSVDLGGKTLPPGVYCFASSAAQSGADLTLDGKGDPNAVWIFQIGSTLTVSSGVSMINSGNACNVYWQVGSSATLDTGAQFKGNILAQASISLLTGADVSPGRTLAQTGAVTMQSSAVSNAGCP
jgi:hypothetical protein